MSPTYWLQVQVDLGHLPPGPAEEELLALGALSVEYHDAGNEAILEPLPGTTPLWQEVKLVALFSGDTKKSEISALDSDDGKKLEDFYSNLLKNLCEKSDYQGAVIADEMGFPIADYRCPIDPEMLAAFTSVLGDCLNKAEGILEFEDANNISLEINDSDKIALRRFTALNSTYFLLVICSQAAVFPGLTEPAISEIVAQLTN